MWAHEFFRHALLTGLLASLACGVVGTYVVTKRIVFLSGGISHAAYGGIGLACFLGWEPLWGATVFAVLAALGMGLVAKGAGQREDTVIGVMWAVGMAIGIIFLSLTPGYSADLMSYLFGSLLTVPKSDLLLMVGLDAAILVAVAIFFHQLQAWAFDEEFAGLMGLPVRALYLLLLGLIALTVVITIRVVGVILVIALLTIPSALGVRLGGSLGRAMVWAVLLGSALTTAGLCLSCYTNLPCGALIILLAGLVYLPVSCRPASATR
jgi:zinc transport system permease protein